MALTVVLDTNVVVSALLKPQGTEDQVLRLSLRGHLQLCTSAPILDEYASVLPRPKLKLEPSEIARTLRELRKAGKLVNPTDTLAVCADERDNRFLECADAAKAEFLITGNTKHFPKQWRGTKIVNARALMEFLAEYPIPPR